MKYRFHSVVGLINELPFLAVISSIEQESPPGISYWSCGSETQWRDLDPSRGLCVGARVSEAAESAVGSDFPSPEYLSFYQLEDCSNEHEFICVTAEKPTKTFELVEGTVDLLSSNSKNIKFANHWMNDLNQLLPCLHRYETCVY